MTMFFTKYNPMTKAEVNAKVAAGIKPDNPISKADCMKDRTFKLILEGKHAPAQLEYHIIDAERLTVTENGQFYEAEYSALTFESGRVVLFSHGIPGTDRAWHVVLDSHTNAVTAFETWFGITVNVGGDIFGMVPPTGTRDIPREVQREYYFGYAEWDNGSKPEKLHTATNRLEGRGFHWTYNCGYELLTFHPSVICCTLVELGDKLGGITMSNPMDYIKIDDRYYILARWEVEFDGSAWIEVIDLFEQKAIGLRYGFNEDDEFVNQFHAACVEITGDTAHLEKIGYNGDTEPPMAGLMGPDAAKGARYAYRPMDIDIPMTHEEALKHAAESQRIFEGASIMSGANNMEFSDYLTGKKLKVVQDDEKHAVAPWGGSRKTVWEYDFIGKDKLKWRLPGGEWQEEKYVAFETDKDLLFFSHMLTGDPAYANVSQAIDFQNGLTTTVRAQIGNWHSEWEIGAAVKFGTLDYAGVTPPFARRHHFTTELVGKSFAWSYSDMMSSIHVYSAPESYSWTIFQDNNNSGGATWSSPGFYVKLRENVYMFQWVEENCNGSQGLVIFNKKIMHDGGFFYGVGHNGLQLNITGAFARELGAFDIKKYFLEG
ncbi:MAG: molybdenum cofactor biosynthesis F family protein [Oscillospiraceae bacterium]|jgi:hypothetical protein|nr:molybdenum cofactor biosynthesis F family protein [Oscillospiraceae bacterium]